MGMCVKLGTLVPLLNLVRRSGLVAFALLILVGVVGLELLG